MLFLRAKLFLGMTEVDNVIAPHEVSKLSQNNDATIRFHSDAAHVWPFTALQH